MSMIVIVGYMCLLGIENIEIYIFMKSLTVHPLLHLGPNHTRDVLNDTKEKRDRDNQPLDHLIISDFFFYGARAPDVVTP